MDAEAANATLKDEVQAKLKSKIQKVTDNKAYYGGKCQELIQEILRQQPTDPQTGDSNTLASVIKRLGIDAEAIQFNAEDDDFNAF